VNGFSVSFNRLELKDYVESLAVVVHMYKEILNVDAAFGIFTDQERNRCMIIGRSDADGIDIGSIMRSMGGGGHPAAGSAVLRSVNPDAAEDILRTLIQGNQQASIQISDLMSFPVITIPPNTRMKKVASMLKEKGCTGFPVVEDGRLVGMISRRDFKRVKKESHLKAPVKAFMKTDVKTIAPGKSPTEAARLMVKYDIGRLPVVDNEKIIGILTRSDTMLYFYDLLPD
jgi:tRNA nucleotidyltransferase (CCA-adding enzyme)